jgi:hypothetical protein
MAGCVGRIGCAVVLLILGAVGWHFRALWIPKVKQLITTQTGLVITQLDGPAVIWGHA